MNNETIVFVGQNASTGTPNRTTGRMSTYGEMYKFNSRKNAIEFAEKNDTGNASCVSVVGTRNTIRKYNFGISVANYNEHIDNIPSED